MHFKEGRSYEFLLELGVLTYWLEAAMKVFYSTQISLKLLPASIRQRRFKEPPQCFIESDE
jgi:hypothetical protein